MNLDCRHCASLQAELQDLRRQLCFEIDEDRSRIISRALRLSPQQGRLLAGLYASRGRALSRGQLCDLIPPLSGPRERDSERIVPVLVARIRSRLGAGLVETFPGHGYALSPAGIAVVSQVLAARPCGPSNACPIGLCEQIGANRPHVGFFWRHGPLPERTP